MQNGVGLDDCINSTLIVNFIDILNKFKLNSTMGNKICCEEEPKK